MFVRLLNVKPKKKEILQIEKLKISDIRPNPNQPRRAFDRQGLEELSASIKRYGVLQPLCVRKVSGRFYELITGERRLRAAEMAGLTYVPVILMNITDKDSAKIALIENLQRQNLSYMEEARGYKSLVEDYGLSVEEIAEGVGKSRSYAAAKLRLLKLSPKEEDMLRRNGLSERHAKALLRIPDEEIRTKALQEIISKDWNARKAESYIENILLELSNEKKEKERQERIKRKASDNRIYTNTIMESVELIRRWGVNAVCNIEEKDKFYEIMIKIPM